MTGIDYASNMPQKKPAPALYEALGSKESGQVGNWRETPGNLRVPSDVRFSDGEIQFCFSAGDRYCAPPSDLLDLFLNLRTDAAIAKFAGRFGPLALFETAFSASPDPSQLANSVWKNGKLSQNIHAERVEWWRELQRQFRAVMALVALFRLGDDPPVSMFQELAASGVLLFHEDMLKSSSALDRREMACLAASVYTNGLMRACGVFPGLKLDFRRPRARIQLVFQDELLGRGLLSLPGALAVQLLGAIAGEGFTVCSACGSPFAPGRRRPAFGKRRYCRACGPKAAVRHAKSAYRSRLRDLGVRSMGELEQLRGRQRSKATGPKHTKGERHGKTTRTR